MKYPGSKWNIAPRLVELIPEHHSYVEPFFGSGAVLFNKPVSDIETINDLDHDVVNIFRCIQEDADRLARMVMTTPFSREKYEDTYKLDAWELMMPDEPYHKALRFLIQCWQGHGFRTNGSYDMTKKIYFELMFIVLIAMGIYEIIDGIKNKNQVYLGVRMNGWIILCGAMLIISAFIFAAYFVW